MDVHVDQAGQGEAAGVIRLGFGRFGVGRALGDVRYRAIGKRKRRAGAPFVRRIDHGDAANAETALRGCSRRCLALQAEIGEHAHGCLP